MKWTNNSKIMTEKQSKTYKDNNSVENAHKENRHNNYRLLQHHTMKISRLENITHSSIKLKDYEYNASLFK